jgi:hypothetical protein
MAISFIPNQPILFEDPLFAGQTCLNNDTRQYAQLAQSDDSMSIQFINDPIATVYSCNMNEFSDVVTNGDFATDLSSWSYYSFASSSIIAPTTDWIWTPNGVTSNPASSDIGLFQTLPGSIGDIFLISIDFTYNNGGDFKIGLGQATIGSWNWVNLLNNYGTNIDGRRCLLVSSYINLDFAFYCNTSEVTIKNIIIRNVTSGQCVVLDSSVNAHWTYVESVNGWQKIDGTSATAFPLTVFHNLVNGTDYRLKYKVMNMPEDNIAYMEVQDNASATLAKTYTNGEFAEYFNYTGPSLQPFLLANPEAQNGIIYDIAFEEMCYDHRISITYPDGSPASIWYDSSSTTNPITYYQDRMIWFFDWNLLESAETPGAGLSSDCYTVTVDDQCFGGIGEKTSYTIINYKESGSHECSVVVRGSCQGSAFGFFFNAPGVNVSFSLLQRLRILQFNPMYPIKTEQYTYSSGIMNRTYAQSGKIRTAWFDYVDEPTHDVIRLQLLCDTLTIDNKIFFCMAEDYEPEWGQNGRYNLAQSKVVMMSQDEPTLFNKNCI